MTTTALFAGLNQEETQQAVLAALLSLATGDDAQATDASVLAVRDALAPLATQATAAAILAKLAADPATKASVDAVAAKLTADPATNTTLAAVLAKLPTDPATGAKLDAILAKLIAAPATAAAQASELTAIQALLTQTTGAAILAKLSADPATATGVAAVVTALGGLGTQTTLAAVLAKLSADPATATGVAAIVTKLSSDPATKASVDAVTAALGSLGTQTTLAAVLAKLSSDPATATGVAAIVTKLTSDPATNTTLAAVLAKLSSDPATGAGLTAILNKLSADPATATGVAAVVTALAPLTGLATQTTLAAVLTKLTADPSTGANQGTEIAALQAIAAAVGVGSNGLTKAEDSAVTTGDRGLATLLMRAFTTPQASTDAAGDYTMPIADAEGKQVMLTGSIPENTWQAAVNPTTASTTAIKAAAAAGIRNYLTDLEIVNGAAVAQTVTILDGTTVIGRYAFAGTIGASLSLSFRTPLRGTPATALNVTTSGAGSVFVNARGYLGV